MVALLVAHEMTSQITRWSAVILNAEPDRGTALHFRDFPRTVLRYTRDLLTSVLRHNYHLIQIITEIRLAAQYFQGITQVLVFW